MSLFDAISRLEKNCALANEIHAREEAAKQESKQSKIQINDSPNCKRETEQKQQESEDSVDQSSQNSKLNSNT